MGSLLLTATPGFAVADDSDALEAYLVESADSPGEHAALARYYRAKAAEARGAADHHKAMARNSKPGMKQHCDRIAKLNQEMAAEFDALAKEQDAAAK